MLREFIDDSQGHKWEVSFTIVADDSQHSVAIVAPTSELALQKFNLNFFRIMQMRGEHATDADPAQYYTNLQIDPEMPVLHEPLEDSVTHASLMRKYLDLLG